MFAKLVGEGFEKPQGDQDVPIDIHYAKVVEWVVDRKVVGADWKKKLEVLQTKAAEESKQLPPGFASQFSGGDENAMNYFRSLEILEKLKETAERGMMGHLKGDAGKWEKIVKAYESSMLHIAEGGLIMARNVDFEIPFLKKQTAKNQQLIEDLDKKSTDMLKNASLSAKAFVEACEEQDIPVECIHHSSALDAAILRSAKHAPSLLAEAVRFLREKTVSTSIEYYKSFANLKDDVLDVLAEVIGGSTDEVDVSQDVKFWIDVGTAANRQTLEGTTESWNQDETEDNSTIEISWDGLEFDTGDAGNNVISNEGIQENADISWDIDISGAGDELLEPILQDGNQDTSAQSLNNSQEINLPGVIQEIKGALEQCSKEVYRLTVDEAYRNKFVDNVLELKAFINQRYKETKSSGESLAIVASTVDLDDLAKMRSVLEDVVSMLTSPRLSNLMSIATSKKYRDRIAKSIQQMAKKEKKSIAASQDASAKKEEIQRLLISDSARISALVRETRAIMSKVQADLGAKLRRRVLIQGGIHNALQ